MSVLDVQMTCYVREVLNHCEFSYNLLFVSCFSKNRLKIYLSFFKNLSLLT